MVIAVIAILASLLTPSLQRGKQSGKQIRCASNLRQIILAAAMYVDENDDRYPAQLEDGVAVRAAGGDGRNFYDLLMPFANTRSIWICPSAEIKNPGTLLGYHMNGLIITANGLKAASITAPSQTLLIAETGYRRLYDQAFLRPDLSGEYLYDRPQRNHSGGSNAGFADGHVKWYHDERWTSNSFSAIP